MKEARRKKTGRQIPCPGPAHSNPYIDNCGICAPRWDVIDELAPIDLKEAREQKLDVPMSKLDEAQYDEASRLVAEGEAKFVQVNRRGANYIVLRWGE